MRYLPLLAILLPGLANAQVDPHPGTKTPVIGQTVERCQRVTDRRVADAPAPGARRLNEMPPAKPIYTVVREIDGCPIPVSVRPG